MTKIQNLKLFGSLDIEIWDFIGIWSLKFEIWYENRIFMHRGGPQGHVRLTGNRERLTAQPMPYAYSGECFM